MSNKTIALFVIIIIVLAACKQNETVEVKQDIIASVNGEYLYQKDIIQILPKNISSEDSAKMVSEYVRAWVANKLLFAEARDVLTDTTVIEQKIKLYREQLYTYYYTENFIYNKVDYKLTEEEIEAYYNKHLQDYVLAKTYVKAHYMTMDAEVYTYYMERDKLFNSSIEDREELEDFCIGTGRKVFFNEDWIELGEFLDIVKRPALDPNELLFKSTFEHVYDKTRYLIKFDDYKTIGDYMPFEIAKPEIAEILINKKKNEELIKKQNQLIEQGLESGAVILK
ncbi:MAG: hypothetical protein JXR36_14895 [Bacteroidales bacterium]|nr:hypothetical protein [Bacteroidales bacterium]